MVPADKAEEARALVADAPELAADRKQPSEGGDTATTINGVTHQGIRPGDRVVIRYLDDNKTATYTLSDARNDPANGVLSVTSPLGKQLLGLLEEDETELEVGGRLRRVLIVRTER